MKLAILSLLAIVPLALAAGKTHWVVTWGASSAPQLTLDQMTAAKLSFDNQTIREIVHTSMGGNTVRVRLSNAYGKQAVEVGAAHIGLQESGSRIAANSDRALTFSGRPAISIPADAAVLSDPVTLNVPSGANLAVSIFVSGPAMGASIHYSAQQTNYIGAGDLTGAPSLSNAETISSWVFLAGVDVLSSASAGAVVAFGDSITDGAMSTVDANHRWPDILASRLKGKVAVMDAGIGGNRILHDASGNVRFGVNALARFDRDVLVQPGVKYVIVLEGINDLGHAGTSAPASEVVSAEDIIAGLRQLIERAHEKGIKIIGATITPFEGTSFAGYFTPEKEVKRKAINEWIRTSRAFDGVIDFEKAARDPDHVDRMLPAYDGGDHLHPSDAGYKAMGEAIDLKLFK